MRKGNSEMSDIFVVKKTKKIVTDFEDGMIKSSFSGNKLFKGTSELSKMSDQLPGRKKNTFEMLHERDLKKSDLPSLSSILLIDKNDSKKPSSSSSDNRIEKFQSDYSSVKKNGNSKKNCNIDKIDSDYQISGMFSDGLSDSPNSLHKSESFTFPDKPVIDSLTPIIDLNFQELIRNDTIDKEYFLAETKEYKNKEKKQNLMKKKFNETESNSAENYSIDSKSIYRQDIGTNLDNDDDLEFLELSNYVKKKSVVKYADSISTSNLQLRKQFKEVSTDGENLLSTTLSNSSKFSFTPFETELNLSQRFDTTSFENLLSSFDISQPEYIERKICSLNKKKAEHKTMFNFKLCKSVSEDIQNSGIVNGLSINLYDKYVTDRDSQTCKNNENQLEIDFSPKCQKNFNEFEKSCLEVDFNKSIESDKMKKGVKRGYPFRKNINLYDRERNGNYGLEGMGGFTSVDRSQNACYNGSIYQFGSPSQSRLSTFDKSWVECPRNSFRNVSRKVKNFVKEWLDSEESVNSGIPRRKKFSLIRKRLFSQSENITENSLIAENQPFDLGSEIFLSNYSSEYCNV